MKLYASKKLWEIIIVVHFFVNVIIFVLSRRYSDITVCIYILNYFLRRSKVSILMFPIMAVMCVIHDSRVNY